MLWPLVVWLVQIAVLVGFALGVVPVHPVALFLPLVGLLNTWVDQEGPRGLGLIPVARPSRVLLLILAFVPLSLGRRLIALHLGGATLRPLPITAMTIHSLCRDLAVDVLIIALWEELVSRGYVQTRLQDAWGFPGVVVATLLFASLHLPSAVLSLGYNSTTTLFRFAQTGLLGFVLGYVYWRSKCLPITIALHGVSNFTLSLSLRLSGLSAGELMVDEMGFQLLWLAGQVGLMLLAWPAVFGVPTSEGIRT